MRIRSVGIVLSTILRNKAMKKISLGFDLLILASIISWVITIWSVSFTYFPADALYYSRHLPLSYWFGVTLTILAVMISIFKPLTKGHIRLLPQIILLLYLHGLPAFTYENMQYYDTYMHAASALDIYHSGCLQVTDVYAKEYPGVFSMLAQILQLQTGSFQFLMSFLRFHSLLILTLSLILVYVVANLFSKKYSTLACFAFLSVMWVEYPHFSPQAYAFILYLTIWFILTKVAIKQKQNRSWTIVLILSLFATIISNPTTPLFLFLSLISAIYIAQIVFRLKASYEKKIIQIGGRSTLLIHLVSWSSWTIFMGRDLTLGFGLRMVIKSFGQFQKLSFPLNPEITYLVSSTLRQLITVYVVLTGFSILVFLFKCKKTKSCVFLLGGGFVGALFAIPLFLFWETSSMLQRVLLFSAFFWSVLIAIYANSAGIKRLNKGVIIVPIIVFTLLMPISKYGAEPFTYLPSSVLSSANFITNNSGVISLNFIKPKAEDPPAHIYDFYISLRQIKMQISMHKNVSSAIVMIKKNGYLKGYSFIFTETYNNEFLLRRNSLEITDVEGEIRSLFNLIYNSGSTRIYGK